MSNIIRACLQVEPIRTEIFLYSSFLIVRESKVCAEDPHLSLCFVSSYDDQICISVLQRSAKLLSAPIVLISQSSATPLGRDKGPIRTY